MGLPLDSAPCPEVACHTRVNKPLGQGVGHSMRDGVPMSDSPCTACRSTANGRLFYAYVNHYVGDDLEKRRVRLCTQCVVDLLVPLLEGADALEGKQWISIETAAPTPIRAAS